MSSCTAKASSPAPSALPDEAQAALDLAPCGLLRADAAGAILRVNRTLCQWLGYTREELTGRRLQELLTMGARIFHQTHWTPLLHMQGSVSEVKLELVHRDGRRIPMVINALRRQEAGTVVDDVAMFVAHDRDRYEKELLDSRRRLQVLVEESRRLQEGAKDRAAFAEQMMGIVSHDLRNPLSTIQMGALLLARGEATPNQLRVLQRMSRAADRAHRLIADLLDFTQARLGQGLAVALRPIELGTVIAEAVDELAQAYPGRRLLHVHEGTGTCMADADRLIQLVGNLVSNAMAYGRADAPVTVRSRTGAQHCELAVHNEGPPIPEGHAAALFQPMTRGTTASGAAQGVGLGLFIVREIAKAHGGTVTVQSGEAEGTTFRAEFPREAAQAAVSGAAAAL